MKLDNRLQNSNTHHTNATDVQSIALNTMLMSYATKTKSQPGINWPRDLSPLNWYPGVSRS